MRALIAILLGVVLAGCRVPAASRPGDAGGRVPSGLSVVPLDSGVYAFIRTEPLGRAVNANSLVIVSDRDVVIVDAQFTREATLEHIAALRSITRKPVSYVVNTHWHDDHVAGNQVYRDTFPDVQFIAHAQTRTDLIERGRPNRTGTLTGAPPIADRWERLLAMGLGIDSTPVTAAERASATSAIRIIRQYLREYEGYREELPNVLVHNGLTLYRSGRRIDIRWLGRGNTAGDLVVHLPAEAIIAAGDLVVHPIPFAFLSYPTEWIAALDSIVALRPRMLVPGHGPVMRDLSYVGTVREMLATARDSTRAAADRELTLENARRVVMLDRLRVQFTADDRWMNAMFRDFFLNPAVGRFYQEAKSGRLK